MDAPARCHVVVVGGGISGLAAAWFLRTDCRLTLLEGSDRLGGKLRLAELDGLAVDVGAESMLARRPEALELTRTVGLGGSLVTPATSTAALWSRGALRALPRGQVMGVPGDLAALAHSGVLAPLELVRAALDPVLPRTPVPADVSVGGYVRARMGRGVVDRLVEPLLGGVYAGRADELSLAATVPSLAAAVRTERSLLLAARRIGANAGTGPLFAGITGGLGRLPPAVATASGAEVRLRTPVRALRRRPLGWGLVVGPAADLRTVDADAVVLAVPARPAARLLAAEVPAAATELSGVDYASVAVVSLAYPAGAFPAAPRGSGFLVPPVEGRMVKAATFSTSKWAWLAAAAPGLVVVRLSVGRYGEEIDLQRDDAELARLAGAELAAAVGVAGAPVAAQVTRWGGGLPQYAVGHVERVARVRAAVAAQPGLAVCGAAYDGVGIAACIASAEAAARAVTGSAERMRA